MIYRVIPFGEILSREYNQDKLNTAFKKFSCQREADLEDFLQEKAVLYEKTNFGKTYLILDSAELDNKNFLQEQAKRKAAEKLRNSLFS